MMFNIMLGLPVMRMQSRVALVLTMHPAHTDRPCRSVIHQPRTSRSPLGNAGHSSPNQAVDGIADSASLHHQTVTSTLSQEKGN